MEENAEDIIEKTRILLSRNKPLALIVGVAGFIGSHVGGRLLRENIQIIGIDNPGSGNKNNLSELVRNKDFHFINQSICDQLFFKNVLSALKLPRLDYAIFISEDEDDEGIYKSGLSNFLDFVKNCRDNICSDRTEPVKYKLDSSKKIISNTPKVVLISSIELYSSKAQEDLEGLKQAEIFFAKFAKHYLMNARVVRLASVFGPGMSFKGKDPIVRLIHAALKETIQDEQTGTDFSTRALYIDDAAELIVKSVLSGSTAQKIYDGALLDPIKVSEIRQILLDPLWHDLRKFNPTQIPPWPTPNLIKTARELSWKPKTHIVEALKKTLAYFREANIEIPDLSEKKVETPQKVWSFAATVKEEEDVKKEDEESREEPMIIGSKMSKIKKMTVFILAFLLIGYGLVYPTTFFIWGAFSIRQNVKSSMEEVLRGDFEKAGEKISYANKSLSDIQDVLASLAILKRLGIFATQIDQTKYLLDLVSEGVDGTTHAIEGSKALYQATKVISGEEDNDLKNLYEISQVELTVAAQKISKVNAKLSDQSFINQYPGVLRSRMLDLSYKMDSYSKIVTQAKTASFLMPQITAVNGKKSYLVLLQNNLELRPTGGFIGSYAKLSFEGGKLTEVKVDDIYNLDGQLKEIIKPPPDIKNDLGQERFFLRDANYEPDFPTSAKQVEFFYRKEAGETVNGVFSLDLTASAKLLNAVGGLALPEYGEYVSADNLFERVISHAEVGFFPGSQAKKNYLTSLQLQLFNKIFYLSKQNWPSIIQAIGESLEQKHILLYLSEPTLFSYLASQNWAGVLPRGVVDKEGETRDFLSVVESNMGANKANYYLKRKVDLDTSFGKDGAVYHTLRINYENSSPSEVFPAGKYKNRLRIYLPLGAQLTKATFGEVDLTKTLYSFSDYGRTGYSMLVSVEPKQARNLSIDYQLAKPLTFKEDLASYRLDVIKQPGTGSDPFVLNLTYPISYKLKGADNKGQKSDQEVVISTSTKKDNSFVFDFEKN